MKRQIAEMVNRRVARAGQRRSWSCRQLRRKRWTWPRRWPFSQTNEAKRGEGSAQQSEQAVSQVTQLEVIAARGMPAGSREAQATDLMRADWLRGGTGAVAKDADVRRAGQQACAMPSTASASPRKFSIRHWMPKKAHQRAVRAITARDDSADADRDHAPDRRHHAQAC